MTSVNVGGISNGVLSMSGKMKKLCGGELYETLLATAAKASLKFLYICDVGPRMSVQFFHAQI